eukprot:m.538727 g.538727  ORF g.538727 m.538727 type:complete len:308 (+) comp22085_c0_seq18:493-1416(+)
MFGASTGGRTPACRSADSRVVMAVVKLLIHARAGDGASEGGTCVTVVPAVAGMLVSGEGVGGVSVSVWGRAAGAVLSVLSSAVSTSMDVSTREGAGDCACVPVSHMVVLRRAVDDGRAGLRPGDFAAVRCRCLSVQTSPHITRSASVHTCRRHPHVAQCIQPVCTCTHRGKLSMQRASSMLHDAFAMSVVRGGATAQRVPTRTCDHGGTRHVHAHFHHALLSVLQPLHELSDELVGEIHVLGNVRHLLPPLLVILVRAVHLCMHPRSADTVSSISWEHCGASVRHISSRIHMPKKEVLGTQSTLVLW